MLHGPICRTQSKNSLCIYSASIFFLIQTARLLFAEHTSLFLLLLPVPPQTGPGFKILSQHLCHMPCVTASFKSIHAAADQGPVKFRFSFLTGPVSISLLTFLSPCHGCVLHFYCFWHSYLSLPVLFSLPPFP